jgi:dipeptidyl aminopeptidase/acylaminoacyl peptidase
MIRTLGLLIAGSLSLSSVLASEQRVLQHEDLWLMPRVSAPLLSPDGSLVVFNLVEPAYKADDQLSDLWIVAADGSGEARRLTATRAPEAGVAWSRDSRRIAFASKREADAQNQIYILDVDRAGEARRVTNISTGARTPQFSPDGSRILFVSNLHPQAQTDADSKRLAEEQTQRKYNARVYTSFPIRNWDRWLDETRPRVFVQAIGDTEARDLLVGSDLLAQPGYDGRTTPGSSELEPVWAPDGESIVFVASTRRDRAAFDYTHTDLWRVPLAGGEPERLTNAQAEAADSYASPRFSPDGKQLLALVNPRGDKVYSASRLARIDWSSGRETRIELPQALSVSTFAASADGSRVYLSAEHEGMEKIFRAAGDKVETRPAYSPERGILTALSSGGSGRAARLVALHEHAAQPPEVVSIDPRNGEIRPLTRFSAERISQLDLPPAEHFWSAGPNGQRIHNMLIRPPGFDPSRKYPLFVLMHGGPHTMWRDMWVIRWHYHLLAAPGYVVLLTNYTGSTGFGEAFAQGIQGDPLKGPADEINAAADAAIERYGFIDGERQCAGGASYGGHLANWLQATTSRYRCLISHAGLISLQSQWGTSDIAYSREANLGGPHWQDGAVWNEQSPIRYATSFQTPVLVTFGENDFRVPINNGLEYWAVLQRQQVESRLVIFPDENHWILKGDNSRYFYQEVHAWLERWLKKSE